MTFYESMQLGACNLKPLIKEAKDTKVKRKYTISLIIKNILCLAFCMMFVILSGKFFGTDNSIVGVVTVIALLTFRFSNLDFKVGQSAITILGIFLILIVSPYVATLVNPIIGLIINLVSIMAIVVFSCHNVMLANQSTFVLSYLLLYGYRVSDFDAYVNRVFGLILGGAIVSIVFYLKQRKKDFDNSFTDILKDFDFTTARTKWQFKLALSISLAVLIGEFLNIPRVIWVAFSCMSILQPDIDKIEFRTKKRPVYVIIGCVIFYVVYSMLPADSKGFIGVIGGLMVGFSGTYQWQTSFNCFGALTAAVPMFGLEWAVIIRIVNNLIGALYINIFNNIFEFVEERFFSSSRNTLAEGGVEN